MLKSILQGKEEKQQERIEKHLNSGIEQLQKKMYNGAMVEFGKAMELDFEKVYPRLIEELDNAASKGDLDAALAVGLNMLKHKKDDYQLANKLGNYARKNKDFKQAKGLYQAALKIKKNYTLAFYNLAAAEIKANLFDEMAVNAVNQFKNERGYILPGYANNENPVELHTQAAKRGKLQQADEKLRQLTTLLNQANEAGASAQAKSIEQEIKALKQDIEKITPDDICREFNRVIESGATGSKQQRFNLAIYALENRKPEVAESSLEPLLIEEFPLKGLLQAIALDQKGQREEAIDMLVRFLGENELNRYYNVNLGLIYMKSRNTFLAVKYLIKAAELLKKSNGTFNMYELLKEANQLYKEGDVTKALEFYNVASSEILDPSLFIKIGTIYDEQQETSEAIRSFKRALELDPKSEEAQSHLERMHNQFIAEGDALMNDKKYSPAVDQYEKALSVFRPVESLKKAASAYRQLNSIKKANQLMAEAEAILNAEKEKESENLRTALVIKAKMMMKAKKYQAAIEFLETAFSMKLDKNIYAQLTMLYKKFKGKDSLSGLEKRWNDMLVAKEREELEARQIQREGEAAQAESEG